jgi:hypothetical protein
VELIESSEPKVEISTNNSDEVELVNKNGELKVRMIPTKLLQGATTNVKVFYKTLQEIQGSQGATIVCKENISSHLLKLTANEGSVLNLKVEVDTIVIKANSGGKINLQGNAKKQEAVVNSGAIYNGQQLMSKNAEITANAGGQITITATESVDAKTRAGGKIIVYGNPKERNIKNILGGKIEFKK